MFKQSETPGGERPPYPSRVQDGCYYRFQAKELARLNPALTDRDRAWAVVTIFWTGAGTLWKDKKGYHARCYGVKAALLLIQSVLKGTVSFRPLKGGRGYWQWTVQRKAEVEWLHKNLTTLLLPPLPEPDRSLCKHCGEVDGYHQQECHLAPGE